MTWKDAEWQGCRVPSELGLAHWRAGQVRSLREPITCLDDLRTRARTLRGPQRDLVAAALYALAIDADGPGLVAHRLLESDCLGDHSSSGNPIAVYMQQSGAIDPVIAGTVTYFGYPAARFEVDLPFVIQQFLIDFDSWRYPKLDEWRQRKAGK